MLFCDAKERSLVAIETLAELDPQRWVSAHEILKAVPALAERLPANVLTFERDQVKGKKHELTFPDIENVRLLASLSSVSKQSRPWRS